MRCKAVCFYEHQCWQMDHHLPIRLFVYGGLKSQGLKTKILLKGRFDNTLQTSNILFGVFKNDIDAAEKAY